MDEIKTHNKNDVINLATRAGRIMLENGGEIYRVEETVEHICKAYIHEGDCGSFATPTVVIASVTDAEGENVTTVQRVRKRSYNLGKVDEVNKLSRAATSGQLSLLDLKHALIEIQTRKNLSTGLSILVMSIAVACFSILFGGNIREFIAGLLVGSVVQVFRIWADKAGFNDYISNLISGVIAMVMAYIIVNWLGARLNIVVSSAIMLAVPGMLFTNALRDIVAGDLMSGSMRLIETIFTALSVAAGAGVTMRALQMWSMRG